MVEELFVTLLAACILFVSWFIISGKNSRTKTLNKPPGPWGVPFLGHIPFFGKHPGITFMNWAKIYGPIFSVRFGQIPAVVLNDGNIIKEAMNLVAFSGKYPFSNVGKPVKIKGLVFADGPHLAEQRKFAIRGLKREEFSEHEFEVKTVQEISKFLRQFRNQWQDSFDNQKPVKIIVHRFFKYPIINSIWTLLVGKRIGEGDRRLETLAQAVNDLAETGRSQVVQLSWYFPCVSNILRFFGLNSVVNALARVDNFISEQIEESKSNYVAGHPKNFTHAYFDQVLQTTDPLSSFYDGQEQRFATADIFMAALDTVHISLDWILLYMAKEPQVQIKLQAEIDNITGFKIAENKFPRTSTISDRDKMPYAKAVITELLRLSSINPLSLFHRTTKNVIFHGYRIPKDTMIVPNLYAAHHDPKIWSEPEKFQPERFVLTDRAKTNSNIKLADQVLPFGAGRRMCVGERIGRDALFLTATHFFQKYSVSLTNNTPSLDAIFGFVMAPFPFELLISERPNSNSQQ